MLALPLLLALHSCVAQLICFDDQVCVDLRADAPAATRARFSQACASGLLWQSVAWCDWFVNGTTRILNVQASNMSRLPDLAAVFLYSRGASLMGAVNTALRDSHGVAVPHQWRDQLVLTGSGLAALRTSPAGDFGPRIVWRAEEPFAGAACTYDSGMPRLEPLAGTLNVTGFESTTTSLALAATWPFGFGATRLLALWRVDRDADGGTSLGWLESPFQREVTIPPPFALHYLACERIPAGTLSALQKNVTVLHAVLSTVTSAPPSAQLRAKALGELRRAFNASLAACDELVCQFMCANSVPPQACTCVTPTQCRAPSAAPAPMRIINEDWVLGRGANARPTCLTNLDSANGVASERIGLSECSAALAQRQTFVFVSRGADLVSILFRNASGLCLSNYSARFQPGDLLALWPCLGGPDQTFRLERAANEFRIVSARSFSSPSPTLCANGNLQQLDAPVLFQPCATPLWLDQERFNAVPLDFRFAHKRKRTSTQHRASDDAA